MGFWIIFCISLFIFLMILILKYIDYTGDDDGFGLISFGILIICSLILIVSCAVGSSITKKKIERSEIPIVEILPAKVILKSGKLNFFKICENGEIIKINCDYVEDNIDLPTYEKCYKKINSSFFVWGNSVTKEKIILPIGYIKLKEN